MNIQEYEKLNHSILDCKYHLDLILKYRKKALYGALRKKIGSVFSKLEKNQGCKVLEGYVMTDHVHVLLTVPPKYRLSVIVGYVKGKSAIYIARHFQGNEKNFTGENFWARGYSISTIGRDEKEIREYIRNQEKEGIRQNELKLTFRSKPSWSAQISSLLGVADYESSPLSPQPTGLSDLIIQGNSR